jgi:hypothetical protein
MDYPKMAWRKGRGKLGIFDPLVGTWQAEADSPMGKVVCTRSFSRVLDGVYVQLVANWTYERGHYKEIALFGVGPDGNVNFWSFTSDKKQSHGWLVDVSDIHPQAIGFEAKMPAGLARMAYWPDGAGGFYWMVESGTQNGWNRFTEHHYLAVV